MWHFPAWRLSISTAQICLIQSSLYIQPLEAYFVLSGAFCSSSYLLLVRPSEVYARSTIYCIDLTLLIIKRSDLCLCFYILMQEHLSMQPASQPSQSAGIQRMKGGPASFIFVLNVIKWFRLVSHKKLYLYRRCLGSAFTVDLAEI